MHFAQKQEENMKKSPVLFGWILYAGSLIVIMPLAMILSQMAESPILLLLAYLGCGVALLFNRRAIIDQMVTVDQISNSLKRLIIYPIFWPITAPIGLLALGAAKLRL